MLDALDPDIIVISGRFTGGLTAGFVDQQQAAGRAVMIDPDLGTFHLRRLEVMPVAYEPLLHVKRIHLSRPSLALKCAFDTLFAMAIIVVLSPVLGAIALAIKLDDRGPVLFRQTRVGRNGRLFPVYKFRTMHVDAEKQLAAFREQNHRNGPLFKLNHDPRVTKIGQFLRDSSLDQLPQLFNVALGHMSLVGPRPALPREVEEFSDELRRREDVRPGITGLWQVEATRQRLIRPVPPPRPLLRAQLVAVARLRDPARHRGAGGHAAHPPALGQG